MRQLFKKYSIEVRKATKSGRISIISSELKKSQDEFYLIEKL